MTKTTNFIIQSSLLTIQSLVFVFNPSLFIAIVFGLITGLWVSSLFDLITDK